MIDQMINSLQRSEASDELIDLAKELCKIINSTTSATAGVVQMIINHESEANGATKEPRPSTSKSGPSSEKSADANVMIGENPLKIQAHRIGVWVKQITQITRAQNSSN
jgi:hypothetical protein